MRRDELLTHSPSSTTASELRTLADLDFSQLTTLFPDPRTPRTPPGDGITNMDFYGADRKLSELGDREFTEFLDSDDIFTPPTSQDNMEHLGIDGMDEEWLDKFFDDPVLNDRMMSEALQPAHVQSEHSYSMTNGENGPNSPLNLKMESDKDLEPEMLINPNMTLTSTSSMVTDSMAVKQEPQQSQPTLTTLPTVTVTPRSHGQTLLKQPTIILATQQPSLSSSSSATPSQHHHFTGVSMMTSIPASETAAATASLMLPKVNIKVEPMDSSCHYSTTALPSPDAGSNLSSPEHSVYDSMGLPPTPPGSSSSDSESGGLSPIRSDPGSPQRCHGTPLSRHQHQHLRAFSQQPLFTSPIPTSGILVLTEEEKRTLVAEGYPIPNKLPLTKQEEKNLKKIRRKIKNKISAQESRRKKKEYMETLEKRMESYSQENTDLRKKVDQLENNNRSLLGQLQKLQALVSKVPRPSSTSTQTGTCLMVFVLFFAMFLGTWSPMNLTIGGYGSNLLASTSASSNLVPQSAGKQYGAGEGVRPMGPAVQDASADPYATPNMRSRVLMSVRDEGEETEHSQYYSHYHNLLLKFISSFTCSTQPILKTEPELPEVKVNVNPNDLGMKVVDGGSNEMPLSMDISIDYIDRVTVATQVNTTE